MTPKDNKVISYIISSGKKQLTWFLSLHLHTLFLSLHTVSSSGTSTQLCYKYNIQVEWIKPPCISTNFSFFLSPPHIFLYSNNTLFPIVGNIFCCLLRNKTTNKEEIFLIKGTPFFYQPCHSVKPHLFCLYFYVKKTITKGGSCCCCLFCWWGA